MAIDLPAGASEELEYTYAIKVVCGSDADLHNEYALSAEAVNNNLYCRSLKAIENVTVV